MSEISRRGLLRSGLVTGGLGLVTTVSLASACGGSSHSARPSGQAAASSTAQPKLTPAQAWARLKEGNVHWAAGTPRHPDQNIQRRRDVAGAQKPFAAVVSCIDSRLPPETVFDEGIGDLFVIRTGAQTVDGLISGSIEYGPLENETPLIVVMGHQRCGAVTATVKSIEENHPLPAHLNDIARSLRPAYREARAKGGGEIIDQTIRTQTTRTVAALTKDSGLAPLIRQGALSIIGAYYSLDTGQVSALTAEP